MLTAKQKSLFAQLNIDEAREPEMRKRHKLVATMGASKDFTTWLTKVFKAECRRANSVVYLGD